MSTNTDSQSVTRSEFNTAIRHLETLLSKQTEILQALAVTGVENRTRDEKTATLVADISAVKKEQDVMKQKFAWLTGAGAVLMAVWPIFAKKLGLT